LAIRNCAVISLTFDFIASSWLFETSSFFSVGVASVLSVHLISCWNVNEAVLTPFEIGSELSNEYFSKEGVFPLQILTALE
jgi:hypothetical protein